MAVAHAPIMDTTTHVSPRSDRRDMSLAFIDVRARVATPDRMQDHRSPVSPRGTVGRSIVALVLASSMLAPSVASAVPAPTHDEDGRGMTIALSITAEQAEAAAIATRGVTGLLESRGLRVVDGAPRRLTIEITPSPDAGYHGVARLSMPNSADDAQIVVDCACAAAEFVELLSNTIDLRIDGFIQAHREAERRAATPPVVASVPIPSPRARYQPRSELAGASLALVASGGLVAALGGALWGIGARSPGVAKGEQTVRAGIGVLAVGASVVVSGAVMLVVDVARQRRTRGRR